MKPFRQTSASSALYGMILFVVLASIYLFFYRGHPLSIDEVSTFDSIKSFSQHGTLSRTIEFYRNPSIGVDGSPFLTPLYEPLQILAGSLFYRLAEPWEQIGQFHTTFLLNVFITALTALSIYMIALRHGYTVRTAWFGAFIFGTATLALPYSRWLFREPLMALFALWAFASAFQIRQQLSQHHRPYMALTILVISTMGMILTKQVGILFVPGLFLCLMPPLRAMRRYLPILAALLGVVILFLVIVAAINPDFGDERYNLARWLNPANLGLDYMVESLLGYQFSPARSIWLYSPILLLGFIGAISLLKHPDTRWLVIGIVFTLLVTTAAYGALRFGAYWSGGWNWGPRYTLPIVPLWILLVLPVIKNVWQAPRWQQITFSLIVLVSIGLQLVGISVPYTDFYNQYYPQTPIETRWLPQNWSWQQNPIAYHLREFTLVEFDGAWRFSPTAPLMAVYYAGLIILGARWIYRSSKAIPPREHSVMWGVLPLLLCVGTGAGLLALHDDIRYIGSRQDVAILIDELNDVANPTDFIFLGGNEYMVLFMNRFKADAVFITLPDEPAERPAPLSDDPSRLAIQWAAKHSDYVWMIPPANYAINGQLRYLEEYLTATLYPQSEIIISPYARATQFYTARDIAFSSVDYQTPAIFEGGLALTGVNLPTSRRFSAGQTIPIQLEWSPQEQLSLNYQVSIQLLAENGTLLAQRDSAPRNNLAKTISWHVGDTYLDYHALALPKTLIAGTYRLEIVLYHLDSLERVQLLDDNHSDSLFITTVEIQ